MRVASFLSRTKRISKKSAHQSARKDGRTTRLKESTNTLKYEQLEVAITQPCSQKPFRYTAARVTGAPYRGTSLVVFHLHAMPCFPRDRAAEVYLVKSRNRTFSVTRSYVPTDPQDRKGWSGREINSRVGRRQTSKTTHVDQLVEKIKKHAKKSLVVFCDFVLYVILCIICIPFSSLTTLEGL